MLDLMRRHASSWIIKIALFGIIVVFVFFFGWGGSSDVDKNFAAKVNGTVITYDQFYNLYENQVELMRSRFKGAMPPDFIEKMNLKKIVLEGMIDQLVLLQEANRLGLMVTDDDLIYSIRNTPEFQNNGVFDPNIYRAYLSSVKATPAIFESNRKQELLEGQVARIIADSVKTNDKELETLWHFQNDKLVLSMLLLKPEEDAKTKEIDSKELEAYYKNRIARYEIPPSIKIQYVVFSWRDLAKEMSISDDEALSYYNSNPKEFLVPEKRRVRHILLKTSPEMDASGLGEIREKAESLRKRIQAGENFDSLARSESQDETSQANGGDLGFLSPGTMSHAFDQAVFDLEVGQVSAPVKSDKGYHIIRVEEVIQESQKTFEDSKKDIADKLVEERAKKKISGHADDFYESVYRSENLLDNAKKFGFEVHMADNVLKDSGLPFAQNDPKLSDEVFQLKLGEMSKMFRIGDEYAIAQVLEKNKERIPELEEIRQIVEKDFLRDRSLAEATKKAESIIEALTKNPNDFEMVAKQNNLEWRDMEPTSRTAGFVPSLGKSSVVTEMLTSVSPSTPIFPQPIPVPEGVAVVRLLKIERASDELFAKEALAFGQWVLEVRKTELLKGWIRALRDKSSIEVNPKLM